MLATWIHCIDPAPIRGQAGMSWSQFVKLHWDVLAASGVFEAQLSMVAQLWIVMTRLGRNPGVRGAQQACALGSGCLTSVGTRRRRMPQEVFPTLRLVSSPPAALQVKASAMEQDRSAPGANRLDLIRMGSHLKRGRGAPSLRSVTVSNEARESGRRLDQRQWTTVVDGFDAVVA